MSEKLLVEREEGEAEEEEDGDGGTIQNFTLNEVNASLVEELEEKEEEIKKLKIQLNSILDNHSVKEVTGLFFFI
jgi:hypothetical protein